MSDKHTQYSVLPTHIGFIMDGNGRWASKQKLTRLKGHDMGAKTVKRILNLALDYNIKIISLFAFSTENWKRPQKEIDHLMKLLEKYFFDNEQEFIEKRISLRLMGDISKFPQTLIDKITSLIERTKNFDNVVLNIGLNYGSHAEIIKAVNDIIASGKKEISEQEFSNYLYTKGIPDPDLIVRTSGEKRLSNFMLYQCVYSELYFTDTLWPDFDRKDFEQMLSEYESRHRRFGGV